MNMYECVVDATNRIWNVALCNMNEAGYKNNLTKTESHCRITIKCYCDFDTSFVFVSSTKLPEDK